MPNTHTGTRVYTELPRSSKPPLLLPLASNTRDTRTHRFLDVCFLVVRAHAALRTIPTTPSTHLPPPYLSRHPDALAPDPKLSCSAPCNPLGGDSYYFHFSNSVGGREASVQHTPPPPSTSLPPSLPPFGSSPSPSYLHPLLRWPAEGKISIFICFFAGYVSLSPSRSYPVLPSPHNSTLRLHLRDSLCLAYFLSFSYSFCFFLLLTSIYHFLPRRGAARPRDRRREVKDGGRERERESVQRGE